MHGAMNKSAHSLFFCPEAKHCFSYSKASSSNAWPEIDSRPQYYQDVVWIVNMTVFFILECPLLIFTKFKTDKDSGILQ